MIVIPITKMGNIVEILSGFAFKSDSFNDSEGIPIIRIRDVVRGSSETRYRGDFDSAYIVNDGEILVGMDGEFNAARWRGGPALLNQRVCRIKSRGDELHDGYLFHFLPSALKRIEDATPFVTVKHLSVKDIRDIDIPLPPLAEQRRIAAILDQAEALRAKRRYALAKLDTFTQSLFLSVYRSNKREATEVPLADVAEQSRGSLVNGPFGSDLLTSELQDAGVPVVYIRDIRDGEYRRVSTVHVSDRKARDLVVCQVMPGDVLVAKVGDPPGISAVYPPDEPPAIVTQDVIRIRVNPSIVVPAFLSCYLNSSVGQWLIKQITIEATRARFSLGDFKRMRITLPPLPLQREFTAQVSAVERLKAAQRASLAKLDVLFASLQHRAFRGEL